MVGDNDLDEFNYDILPEEEFERSMHHLTNYLLDNKNKINSDTDRTEGVKSSHRATVCSGPKNSV